MADMHRLIRNRVVLFALCAIVPGAGQYFHSADPPAGTASHGRKIYAERGCANCHAANASEEEGPAALLRAGHPLAGAAYRGSWWNGRITTDAGDASDHCFKTYIDPGSEGFEAAERKALVLFMQALGSDTGVSPLTLLRRDAGDVDLRTGDVTRGRDLYRRACVSCHGGGDLDAAESFVRKSAGTLSAGQIAALVRGGGQLMPFFQIDRLTAEQVADIAVYVGSLRQPR